MGERICSVPDCGLKHYGRGWCVIHYRSWYRGDRQVPLPPGQREKSPEERFWEKVDAEGDCWMWTGAVTSNGRFAGYGVAWSSEEQRTMGAHRLAWSMLVGPVDAGLELDHLCRNRACVNPDHLQPVTHLENVRRGRSGWNTSAKTHCPHGHEYAGENLITYQGRRFCRACRKLRWRNGDRGKVA